MLKKASELQEGDLVDLEATRFPFKYNNPLAAEMYGQVGTIIEETPTCLVFDFGDLGTVAVNPDQKFQVFKQAEHKRKRKQGLNPVTLTVPRMDTPGGVVQRQKITAWAAKSIPGLAIHPGLAILPRVVWHVTHVALGRVIATVKSEKAARAALKLLGPVTDWTRDAESIVPAHAPEWREFKARIKAVEIAANKT